jgi:hypothetical protein
MSRNKPKTASEAWGFSGNADTGMTIDRSLPGYAEMVAATKLRTLSDMSEREIKALEKQYGAKVIRPAIRNPRRRKNTVTSRQQARA